MKKSIKIFTAIILAVTLISLYRASHHPLNGFDLCIFISLIFVGVMIGRNEETSIEGSELTLEQAKTVELLKKSDEKAKNWRQQLEIDRKAIAKEIEKECVICSMGNGSPAHFDFHKRQFDNSRMAAIAKFSKNLFSPLTKIDFREGVEL